MLQCSIIVMMIILHLMVVLSPPYTVNMLHATDCNKVVTKLKQSCNTLVTALLQFVACNMLHSVWWAKALATFVVQPLEKHVMNLI